MRLLFRIRIGRASVDSLWRQTQPEPDIKYVYENTNQHAHLYSKNPFVPHNRQEKDPLSINIIDKI